MLRMLKTAGNEISFYALIFTLTLPLALVESFKALGFKAEDLGFIGIIVWVLLVTSAVSAFWAVRTNGSEVSRQWIFKRPKVLLAATILAALGLPSTKLIGIMFFHELPEAYSIEQSTGKGTRTSDDTEKQCAVVMLSDSEPETWKNSGDSGGLGWVFWIGNYYTWDFVIDFRPSNEQVINRVERRPEGAFRKERDRFLVRHE